MPNSGLYSEARALGMQIRDLSVYLVVVFVSERRPMRNRRNSVRRDAAFQLFRKGSQLFIRDPHLASRRNEQLP